MASPEDASEPKVSKRVEKELHQTKVIIRRLPPDFTEEKLIEKLSPLPPHNYFYFAPGDPTLGPHGCSRAYISFSELPLILPFRDQFDGSVFETEKGQKYRAIVEFAPYQNIPKKSKRKPDTRCGTIEQDADYQAFLQLYETKPEPRPSIDLLTYSEDAEANKIPDVQVTPLIEYLKEKRRGSRGSKNKVLVVESKRKRKSGESTSKTKGAKSSSKGGSESDYLSKGSKSRLDEGGKSRHEKAEKSGERGEGLRSGSAIKLGGHEKNNSLSNHVEDVSGSRTETVGGSSRYTDTKPVLVQDGGDPWPNFSGLTTMKEGGEKRNVEQSEKRRGAEQSDRKKRRGYREERKGKRGGEYQPEGEGGSRDEKERSRPTRNKDRPDKAIYTPRPREQGEKFTSKEGSSVDQSRSKQDYFSKYDDFGGYRSKRDGGRSDNRFKERDQGSQYYGDDYSRKDRRDREYEGRRGRGRGRGYSRDTRYDSSYDRPKSSSRQDK